jgi:UDP-N-acetyl-D-galactosamine dehydrogenase
MSMERLNNSKICIIGLGYVGMPLAHAFSFYYKVVGFDIDSDRINNLTLGCDKTLELTGEQVKESIDNGAIFTSNADGISDCNVYIITVPTPVDKNKQPDLTPLIKASKMVGSVLSSEDLVIYESTVYPGATEEVCVPVLENNSGLEFNKDFYCGYSPERINPGDKEHTVTKILKVTSGSTKKVAKQVDDLYKTIITAGTHLAPSIKVAEAAKVIENSQRDINIAFVNELAMIFNKLEINTSAVLEAAGTKWNFLPFTPGLVGGHCIGVDPYYLTFKAQELGYNPEIILAGRRINDNMGVYIASQVVKLMIQKNVSIQREKILVLGFTFKENCTDIRNTRVVDIVRELQDFGCNVSVSDSWADIKEVKDEYGIELIDHDDLNISNYTAVILAVAHDEYKCIKFQKNTQIIYDVKSITSHADGRL